MTTGITIPQLPDGATLDDTDLLEIVRTAADGTQSSMRVSASYFLAWLDGKDLSDAVATAPGSETTQTLASVAGVANGAATAAAAAGKAAAGAQATANAAIPSANIGKANGVAGLDASGNVTAPVTGDASGATVIPTGSAAGAAGTKLSDIAKTANGAVQSSQAMQPNGYVSLNNNGAVMGPLIPAALTVSFSLGSAQTPWGVSYVQNQMYYGPALRRSSIYGWTGGSCITFNCDQNGNMTDGTLRAARMVLAPTPGYVASFYYTDDTGDAQAWLMTTGVFAPGKDNAQSIGSASLRPSQIFAGTSAINTSDATEKTLASSTSPFTLAQIKAALRPLETVLYQWNDMILKKGEKVARYHVGYLAQDVYALLMQANIDPTMTAMWCNDALTQEVLVTPGKEAVTTTDPETGAVTIVTPAVDPVYETQPVIDPTTGKQKYRQGLRMTLVHAVLIDDNRDRIATLEAGYAALVARVATLEAKNS